MLQGEDLRTDWLILSPSKCNNKPIYSILQYGNYRYEFVDRTSVQCKVLSGVVCEGNSTFFREGVPCVKYVNCLRNWFRSYTHVCDSDSHSLIVGMEVTTFWQHCCIVSCSDSWEWTDLVWVRLALRLASCWRLAELEFGGSSMWYCWLRMVFYRKTVVIGKLPNEGCDEKMTEIQRILVGWSEYPFFQMRHLEQ